ncbi:glycoside hydrolase family 11 protein [Acetivibrio clariflavus]|uniref:endo-1,4-beta-xylanase n=2 Tax=Acetivibrio clariflavus TaxID=288965 RepID=G8M209_ACECE|nr:glycoside hydrolase family 11 protein [Acetivibrio clariflavus]AEV68127.1 CBM6-containing protein,glycosyl hydrolase family 11,dockerin-like protein [Acetivibrio clariflavus DSM 19732]
MKHKLMGKFSILMSLTLLLSLLPLNVQAKTVTSNETGTHGGYNYEYWKDSGNGTMVLKDGGAFSCEWNNINNILFRKGLKFDETKTHQQIGYMTLTYSCDYQPNGNSYLAVYGWTSDPLVEYYVIESWGTWKPPGNVQSKGTITVDGGVYDIFETTRYNQPSIKGNATFQQYWSVRQQKRTSGTVSVTEHFKAWEAKGMKMGKFYEISLVVEGYQSSGKADVTMMSINIGGNSANPTGTTVVPTPASGSGKSAFSTIEAEDFDNAYGSSIRSIGMGVGYIENGNYLVYNNINFGDGASAFSAKVANGNTTATTIQLRLGSPSGTLIGSLSVPSTGGWNNYEELSTTVSGASGTKDLYLCFNGPVNIDCFSFAKGNSNTNPINPGYILLGDVDQNGTINSLDYAKYKMYLLGMISSLPEEGDINRDGDMNSIDYAMLKQHLLGIINLEELSGPKTTPTPVVIVTPTPTKTPSEGTFHCFLLLGQSNMAGWARAQDSDKIPNPRILALGYDNNQWGVAVPPLHEAFQGAIGPGDWFAKTIIERLPENDTIGLIPCAISGEKIETFMKNGGSKYNWIVSRARMAQQRGGVIEGILFHQGESNNGQQDWPNKVSTLISDLKKDLGLGDIPVLVGELLYTGSCAGHNTLVNRLPSMIPNCYVISAQGLSGDPADFWGLHFNHDSTVEFGKRYAKKMIEVLGW